MPTLYFSYSLPPEFTLDTPEPLNAPYTITWHVGRMLRKLAIDQLGYRFEYVNLDDTSPREFQPGDIAIGHLWHAPDTFMRQALASEVTTIILQPYSHQMVSAGDVPEYVSLFEQADALLFVTGEYWFDTMTSSPFASIRHKVTRLDMAVNPDLHPLLKTQWSTKGKRGLLTLGGDLPVKGLHNVAELACAGGYRLQHIGSINVDVFAHVPQCRVRTGIGFTREAIAHICQESDFFLAMGESDANPTTLLETACWGLIPLCTPQSGYWPDKPFPSLMLRNLLSNLQTIDELQQADAYELSQVAQRIRERVVEYYTWARFCNAVKEAVLAHLD